MKKFLTMLACVCGLAALGTEYRAIEYTPDTNNVVTITGDLSKGMTPMYVMQEITGTNTNTVASVYQPKIAGTVTTNEYRLNSLAAVVGGAELPEAVTAGVDCPAVLKKDEIWTLTNSGVDYTNVVLTVIFEVGYP